MELNSNNNIKDLFFSISNVIIKNKEYLSEIDGASGDGDHGVNMNKGFLNARNIIEDNEENLTISKGFSIISKELASIGGSMGAIYSVMFDGFSIASNNINKISDIDEKVMLNILEKGYEEIRTISDANVGDKTFLDVYIPSINSIKRSIDKKMTTKQSLEILLEDIKNALDNTKNMKASIGRASRLGDRSIGNLDAGACSFYMILREFILNILNINR